MTSSNNESEKNPLLTFEGKKYEMKTLSDEIKNLVRGMQVAEGQLRMQEDSLKLMAAGRKAIAQELGSLLKDVTPIAEE